MTRAHACRTPGPKFKTPRVHFQWPGSSNQSSWSKISFSFSHHLRTSRADPLGRRALRVARCFGNRMSAIAQKTLAPAAARPGRGERDRSYKHQQSRYEATVKRQQSEIRPTNVGQHAPGIALPLSIWQPHPPQTLRVETGSETGQLRVNPGRF